MATIEAPANSSSETGLLRDFFFRREIPCGMALMRIFLPCTLLIDVLQRWPHVREIYSADGAPGPLADNFGYLHFLPEFPGSVAVALFTAMTFLLVTSSIGWCTRFSLLASTVLYAYFGLMDCMSTITKYTVIATHLLLLLGLSDCGVLWSVDAWLRRRRGAAPSNEELRSEVWPQRLVQLLLGFIYFGAAITKIHTPAFFSGDQLMYWMMTYINNQHALGDLLAQFPLVLSVMGYVTITWELVFLFTVFQPRLKWWVLAIGALFHLMTAFTLGLYVFPLVMIASYLPFVTPEEVRHMAGWPLFRRWSARGVTTLENEDPAASTSPAFLRALFGTPGSAWASFAAMLLATCSAAVAIEHRMDPYAMRGPGGPMPLRELSQDEVDRFFGPEKPLRGTDKLLAFDLGTTMVGEHLVGQRREYRQGEQFFAQLTLSPPHEDMWIECILTTALEQETEDGRIETAPGKQMIKVGQAVARESFRANFVFKLDESCEPGQYLLRLKSGKEQIGLRKFTLLPNEKAAAPAAN